MVIVQNNGFCDSNDDNILLSEVVMEMSIGSSGACETNSLLNEDGDRDSDSDGGWCLLLGICCGDRCAVLVEL